MSAGRTTWRDTVAVAADVALLGILVTMAALPLLTAGAAVATGSAALHHQLDHDRWPTPAELWRTFRRALLPGLAATAVAAALTALLAVDLLALRRGAVPGGTLLIVVTAVLAVAVAGFAALVVVALGARGGHGWRAAVRAAATTVSIRPTVLAATGPVVALAALLGLLVHPALTPVLLGYALFAVHAVVRRAAPPAASGVPVASSSVPVERSTGTLELVQGVRNDTGVPVG